MKTIVYTYPEYKELIKKIEAGLPILNKIPLELDNKLPGIVYDVSSLDNIRDLVENYYKTNYIPDEINGIATNKDFLLKQLAIPDFSELYILCETFERYCILNGIDKTKVYIKDKTSFSLNKAYLNELKEYYSIVASNPYDKSLISSYIQIIHSINKYNKVAKEYGGETINSSTQLIRLFDFNGYELNSKAGFLYEIVQSQKNK